MRTPADRGTSPGCRVPAAPGHGRAQRDPRLVLRRRPLPRPGAGRRARPPAASPTAPTSSTWAASRPGPGADPARRRRGAATGCCRWSAALAADGVRGLGRHDARRGRPSRGRGRRRRSSTTSPAGCADPTMLPTVAALGVAYVADALARALDADAAAHATYGDVVGDVTRRAGRAARGGRGGRDRPGPDRGRPGHRLLQDRRPELGRARRHSSGCTRSATRCWSRPAASASSARCWPTRRATLRPARAARGRHDGHVGARGGRRGVVRPRPRRAGHRWTPCGWPGGGPAAVQGRPGSPGDRRATERTREVEAVNAAFYEAFESADLDTCRTCGSTTPTRCACTRARCRCGGPGAINRSWALIMANTPYIQFFLTDVEVSVLDGGASPR